MECSGIQDIYDQLTRGVHVPPLSLYIYIQCSGISGMYDQLTRGFISFLYIYVQFNGIQDIYD